MRRGSREGEGGGEEEGGGGSKGSRLFLGVGSV